MKKKQIAIIIGAGPAGLTAAYELLKKTEIKPIIFEATNAIGGIARTVQYHGNRIDIGGHRFFSKSKRIMDWWQSFFPVQGKPAIDEILLQEDTSKKYQLTKDGPDPERSDLVMLLRKRISRIYFLRKFFDYPVTLSFVTLKNLGVIRVIKIVLGYLTVRLFPIRPEQSLADFFVNRFGSELYQTFFKDYTEKVWGITCDQIPAEWGAQRIKGLSISKTISHAIKMLWQRNGTNLEQQSVETSLIDQFMYPKYGPGQFWEEVARQVVAMGGELHQNVQVVGLQNSNDKILTVGILRNGEREDIAGDYFFSTMPIKDLISGLKNPAPDKVIQVADGLKYRDFITVGLLLNQLKIKNETTIKTLHHLIPDNWIYIQEREVKVGRIQIFNNWSPYLVKDLNKVWIGLEYFCNQGDQLWTTPDDELIAMAIAETSEIDIIESSEVIDQIVIRIPKTYPAYFGSYDQFATVKNYLNGFENLFLIGRNGMHRYNNMDHSMLTAMVAVDNIVAGIKTKENIWEVNTESSYHEER